MVKSPAETILERETRVAYGPVPNRLFDPPLRQKCWQMKANEFLLRGDGEDYFHYRLGQGVTIQRGSEADGIEESLWLNGTVYAAIASMNGLLPIHASAVAFRGSVVAFAGPARAGKSTLIAGLGKLGLPMFCDDTLILDLSDPDQIMCLPGHKRLKLTADAIEMTGADPEERVSPTYDKYHAKPFSGTVDTALPMGELIFLEEGNTPQMSRISGSERFRRTEDDHYTFRLFEAARQYDRSEQFAHRMRLARQIKMALFQRPYDRSRFEEGVLAAANYITNRQKLSA